MQASEEDTALEINRTLFLIRPIISNFCLSLSFNSIQHSGWLELQFHVVRPNTRKLLSALIRGGGRGGVIYGRKILGSGVCLSPPSLYPQERAEGGTSCSSATLCPCNLKAPGVRDAHGVHLLLTVTLPFPLRVGPSSAGGPASASAPFALPVPPPAGLRAHLLATMLG